MSQMRGLAHWKGRSSFQLPPKMTEKFDHGFRVDLGIRMETEAEMDTVAGGSYAPRSNGGDL